MCVVCENVAERVNCSWCIQGYVYTDVSGAVTQFKAQPRVLHIIHGGKSGRISEAKINRK